MNHHGHASQVIKAKENYFKIDSITIDNETVPETEVNITLFSNRVFVVITQLNKLGTMVFLLLITND